MDTLSPPSILKMSKNIVLNGLKFYIFYPIVPVQNAMDFIIFYKYIDTYFISYWSHKIQNFVVRMQFKV